NRLKLFLTTTLHPSNQSILHCPQEMLVNATSSRQGLLKNLIENSQFPIHAHSQTQFNFPTKPRQQTHFPMLIKRGYPLLTKNFPNEKLLPFSKWRTKWSSPILKLDSRLQDRIKQKARIYLPTFQNYSNIQQFNGIVKNASTHHKM